jgi:hypothetical protein
MDIETINKYIELDKQIKNRIVQISNALRGVRDESISKFVPSNVKHRSDLDIRYANDFLENSECDGYLNLAYLDDDYCLCEFNFDKELLCIDDATLVKIKDYDNEKTKEELEKARERERIRQEKLKIDVEKREYQQYLRLKEKFEKKEVSK